MRPPPKRGVISKARGHVISARSKGDPPSASQPAVQAFMPASPSTRGEGSSVDSSLKTQVPTQQSGTSDERRRVGDRPLVPGYRMGDLVMARTAGKPAREATIVEVDPSDDSRFSVAFKDKRKKGGWRDKSELSPLSLPKNGSSAASAAAVGAGAGASGCDGGAAAEPARLAQEGKHETETNAPAASAPLPIAQDGPAMTRDQQPATATHSSPLSTQQPTGSIADTNQLKTPPVASADAAAFRIGDVVLVPAEVGSLRLVEAAVVGVRDSESQALFKLRLKDGRQKNIWRAADDLTPTVIPRPNARSKNTTLVAPVAPSTATPLTEEVVSSEATSEDVGKSAEAGKPTPAPRRRRDDKKAASKRHPSLPKEKPAKRANEKASDQDVQAPESNACNLTGNGDGRGSLTTTKNMGVKTTAKKSQQHAQRRKDFGKIDSGAGPYWQDGPLRKRAAAAAAACAISSTSVGATGARRMGEQPRAQPDAECTKKKSERTHTRSKSVPLPVPVTPSSATSHIEKAASNEVASKGVHASAGAEELALAIRHCDGKVDKNAASRRRLPLPSDETAEKAKEKASSSADVQAPASGVCDSTESGEGRVSPTTTKKTGEETTSKKSQQQAQRRRDTSKTGFGAGSYWQDGPLGKRAAATAAAGAISSISSTRTKAATARRLSEQPQASNDRDCTTNNAKSAHGKSSARRVPAGATPKTPRKLRHGWQRPKVVTPGSVEGRSESALRITHPAQAIRLRKQFKVQQARITLESRNGAKSSKAHPASFTATGTNHRVAHRPLCQPAHSLRDAKRGIGGSKQASSTGGQGDDQDVRRGRRARRQVHPSLSEEVMAAANGSVESDDGDDGADEEGDMCGDGGSGAGLCGEAPLRFRKSEDAPWGKGDKPLIKVRLSLLEDGAPLSAERSALAVVTFVFDRHRYSGEQLANVLTAEGFLCYCDEDTRVFVLTEGKEADHKGALTRVRDLALSRCGVRVEVAPWLAGRPALDEFLDNHRRVLDVIVRHRLACGMWSEVDGVFFNALFCGRRAKRTFNGVRLGINLATSHNSSLETGVWELWITVEPAVHRFSPVDWWDLLQEKENKGLRNFSGSKSDDLEERLQVLCLPKLSRGVVFDVKEDVFEMDRLQEANFSRGYLVGPRSEDEMVEYWRQVHHISLPSSNFVFVKVLIGGMVLTYPSWCVVRGQREVPEATQAMRGRILDAFTDAIDAVKGMTVLETTFSWHMLGGDGGACGTAPAFATANGTLVGQKRDTAPAPLLPEGALDCGSESGVSAMPKGAPGDPLHTHTFGLCTPGPVVGGVSRSAGNGVGHAGERDRQGSRSALVVTPHTATTSPRSPEIPSISAGSCAVSLVAGTGDESPQSRAAAAAAQASLAVVRQSAVRRRGGKPNRVSARPLAAEENTVGEESAGKETGSSATRLCSNPFVIRRQPSSAGARQSMIQETRDAGKSRPLGLSGGTAGGGIDRDLGHNRTPTAKATESAPGTVPRTPQAADRRNLLARLVTPTARDKVVDTERTGTAGVKRTHTVTPQEASTENGRKKKKKTSDEVPAAAGSSRGKRSNNPSPDRSRDIDASGQPSEAVASDAGVEAVAVAPPTAPTKIVVTFSAAGSLGMGVARDGTEEGSVVLAGKAPTSAAAPVPVGWRLTEVDGKSVRCLGDEKIASLLSFRPVDVTFEAISAPAPTPTPAPKPKPTAAPSKRAPAKPKAGKVPKGKKAAKVTTVRKAFKVQSRGQGGKGQGGGDADPAATGPVSQVVAAALPASVTRVAI